jgi:hypothetical protein
MFSVAASAPTASGVKMTPMVQLFPGPRLAWQKTWSLNWDTSPVVAVNVTGPISTESTPWFCNFCYGHREVTSIDNATLGTNGVGAKTVAVSYHYQIAKVADWANSSQMKTAYPGLASSLGSNPSDNATLVMNGDHWAYTK